MLRLLSISALMIAGGIATAQADVFRWVDEQGVPHYSDQWVPGSTIVKTGRAHPTTLGSDEKSLSAASNKVSSQLADQENARAVHEDMEKARDAQCKQAQDRYMKAIESRRVYKDNKNGEREYLSDQEADAYRELARKDVQTRCGSVPQFNPDQPLNPQPQAMNPQPAPIAEPKPLPKQ